ncbi:MAG: M1 family metallopeptidase [Gemmatimonadaceae bacterium]|nr:M1 family metallopeptidase [Gemmatimonadaceae bacterium]NUQ93381.1 M1 family metallopeptidase [Gemmatimonadaceae bacterium]NUR20340.1 M1 family metallopeptidase [Gemmatimonadaceae bacterium]NUS95798.1 M1 family metallopeptidase [Gemmatimonadaceae bacterium]
MRPTFLALAFAALPLAAGAQEGRFTHADTLRGSNTPERAWWDAAFYDLHIAVSPRDSSIRGWNGITYTVLGAAREMQIDLSQRMTVDSIVQDGARLTHRRDGNALFVRLASPQEVGSRRAVTVWYHGKPVVAVHAPWDGGFVWTRDSVGNPWFVTAVEGIGASTFWPLKDSWADEPDSQRVAITVPDGIMDVSNGRLRRTTPNGDGTTTWEWFVSSPINSYDIAVNAGKYAHIADSYEGKNGKLTLDFYPLAIHEDTARKQFAQAKSMLACFEEWFGPYPWYEDGYKLVETPHLGMEHQSAVAYGNHFKNGYLGQDLSHTGLGLSWDYIIVHESGHEWFGNNITAKDPADMWVHEGFTSYSEGIYVECQKGKAAGARYLRGLRANIENDRPVVGVFGVNNEGSGDMYYKGANMLHTVRHIVADDAKWKDILRGLNSTFRRQTVSGEQVERYISQQAGTDLSKVFAQYLTTTKIPAFQYRLDGQTLVYRWSNVVDGFDMPLRVAVGGTPWLIRPGTSWQRTKLPAIGDGAVVVDPDFFVTVERASTAGAASGTR